MPPPHDQKARKHQLFSLNCGVLVGVTFAILVRIAGETILSTPPGRACQSAADRSIPFVGSASSPGRLIVLVLGAPSGSPFHFNATVEVRSPVLIFVMRAFLMTS